MTRVPIPATEIMLNIITLPPPNLRLLFVHWGIYRSLRLRRMNLFPVPTEQVKLWLIAKMTTIPLFCISYDVFSGKFQSPHFVLFGSVKCRSSCSATQIYFIKSSGNSVPWYFNAKVSINSFRDSSCCCKLILFDSWPTHLSSLAVVFLGLPGSFWASHNPIFSSFLKTLWILCISPQSLNYLQSRAYLH